MTNIIDRAAVLITLFLIICHEETSSVEINENNVFQLAWNYKWSCGITGKCKRIHQDKTTPSPDELYATQNMCRLACGRYGGLWPRPTGVTIISTKLIQFNPETIHFEVENQGNFPKETRAYFDRIEKIFIANIMRECTDSKCDQPSNIVMTVSLSVSSSNLTLSWDTDESYGIDVTSDENKINVQIKAITVFGARHGLETLSQLITASPEPDDVMKLNGLVITSGVRIRDRPIYAHRGLMLDTSRNFIPLRDILRTLDGMAASKLNVFHWHATDSHSFPIEITRVPQMTRYGAYSSSAIYYRDDIEHVYSYAKDRGIRVLLELDAPSHAGNGWQWGPSANLGDLAVCVEEQPWRNLCIQPPCGQLNPANLNLYRVLRNIYKDFVEYFPSGEAFHMGGDEVFFACWNSSSEIVNLLKSRGHGQEIGDFLQLWAEFQAASVRIWDEETGLSSCARDADCKSPSPIILWSSHLTEPDTIEQYLQKDRYIIQTWVESTNDLPQRLLSKGYRIIVSTKNTWYLDHGFWGVTQYHSWRIAYRNRIPRTQGVLGGEACMWTEYVDGNSLDARVWPRAAAVAERLWSDPETDTTVAEPRFYRHRARLIDRGLRPEAVTPKWCLQNEGDCI